MQPILKQLLRWQLVMLLLLCLAAWAAGYRAYLSGLVGGGLMAIISTVLAMLIFRRLPQVMPAKWFFTAMIVHELLKWVVVVVLSLVMLPYVAPLGLAVGFLFTYSAYFALMRTTSCSK